MESYAVQDGPARSEKVETGLLASSDPPSAARFSWQRPHDVLVIQSHEIHDLGWWCAADRRTRWARYCGAATWRSAAAASAVSTIRRTCGRNGLLGLGRDRRLALAYGDAAKRDVTSLPVNAEGRRAAGAWDLAADEASGNQCKGMRNRRDHAATRPPPYHVAGREDAETGVRRGNADALLSFDKSSSPQGEKTWQGYSVAAWEGPVRRPGRGEAGPENQFGIGGGTGFGDVPGGGGQGRGACHRRGEDRWTARS